MGAAKKAKTKAKHAPGEWRMKFGPPDANGLRSAYVVGPDGVRICEVAGGGSCVGNAHLIIGAPELLAKAVHLANLVEAIAADLEMKPGFKQYVERIRGEVAESRAAIARARGELVEA